MISLGDLQKFVWEKNDLNPIHSNLKMKHRWIQRPWGKSPNNSHKTTPKKQMRDGIFPSLQRGQLDKESNEEKTEFNRSRVGRMFHAIFQRNNLNRSLRFNFQIFFQKSGETTGRTEISSWDFFYLEIGWFGGKLPRGREGPKKPRLWSRGNADFWNLIHRSDIKHGLEGFQIPLSCTSANKIRDLGILAEEEMKA